MSKAIKQLIITGVLIIVLVLVMLNSFKSISKKKTKKSDKGQQATANLSLIPENIPADKKLIFAQKKRAESLEWGRDPFVYVETEKDKNYRSGTLTLKGISLGKDKVGFAFINNEIVKIGDTIGDHQVLEVDKDKVLLRKGSQSFYLVLPEE
ncbi:MAG: hypothetical protein KKH80_00580 [Candidatus Omnitrophica bacterium]|nr:hypothetical protein [Candidatus Omnitrophota bacterium]